MLTIIISDKLGGKKVIINFKERPVMAMSESKNECEIKDADVAMDLLQNYGVEIKKFEIYYLTLLEKHCAVVNRYIQEHDGQITVLLKHDEDMDEESILDLISQFTAKEAFDWAEATGHHKYKVLVGKSLSKDASK